MRSVHNQLAIVKANAGTRRFLSCDFGGFPIALLSGISSTLLWTIVVELTLVGAVPSVPASAEDYSGSLPRIEATSPVGSLEKLAVVDGYRVELIASEPLVNSPVAAEWSATGELFVCEMRGYSEDRDDGLSRISRLIDEDDDGVYDHSTVYADGLLWPTAILPYRGGLFVGDAPNLWYMKDTDGDGVADQKAVVLTGFSVSNVQGLMNSFRWGLDNRIHVAVGTSGGKVRRPDQAESEAVSVRGFDLAFDPETFQFSRTSGGAQHGMCFDDWGRKFVCSNSDHLQQVMYEDRYLGSGASFVAPAARLSIAADGPQAEVFRRSPVEPWRILRTKLRVAGVVGGPVEGGGRAAGYFTGATGATIYRGDAWPESESATAVIGDVGSNLIHRKRLVGNGVPFQGQRIDQGKEFVASTDNWFRPAQFACGPDGALTVIDVYREVIEHPKSLPPDIKRHLDLTAGRDRGRLYRIVPVDYRHRKTGDLSKAGGAELVALLNHPNAWHRETASRLIFERQDRSVVPSLRQLLRDGTPLGRMHAMYALDGLGELKAGDVVSRLADQHPQVTRHAVRLAEGFSVSDQDVVSALESLVNHPSLEVRYQLAFSLSKFPGPKQMMLLASILVRDIENRWVQTAVMSSAGREPDRLMQHLIGRIGVGDGFLVRNQAIFVALAKDIRKTNARRAIESVVQRLNSIGGQPALLPVIEQFRTGDWRTLVREATAEQFDRLRERSIQIAIDQYASDKLSDADRIAALRNLGGIVDDRLTLATMEVLQGDESLTLTAATLRSIDRQASIPMLETILSRLRQWSPRLRNAACEVLFSNPTHVSVVFEAIDEGICDSEDFPITQWQRLAESKDDRTRERAEKVIGQFRSTSRDSVIEQYRSVLAKTGSVKRGEVVFRDQCAGCHQVGAMGHVVGPSLMAAATRGAESILTNVLDPNREVNPQYRNYVVLTVDGRTFSGMIVAENSSSVTLRAAESVESTVPRSEIEWIRDSGVSIMPEGLEKVITPDKMADLIAYLLKDR